MSRLHFISTIVFIVALSTYGYIQWQKTNEISIAAPTDLNKPDYIARSLSSNKYDSNGKLSHTIYADEMEHFSTQNKTIFTAPKFAFNISCKVII
jgi:lipopolysaccharide export system protein LptC